MAEMDMKTITLIIFGIIILYLLYKTRNVEGFAVGDDIKEAIKEIYTADIDAIRNLSSIATDITKKNDTLTIPVGNTKMSGNTEIAGKLTVGGDVEFINKDTGFMNIMPKFTVLSIAMNDTPKGWALCDGKTYKLNSVGVAYEVAVSDTTGTKTPDLRGRMILGAGAGDGLTNRTLNQSGGAEKHTLTSAEMPSHAHHQFSPSTANRYSGGAVGESNYPAMAFDSGDNGSYVILSTGEVPRVGLTSWIGNNQSHNNMPPFYVLIYIMKL